MRFLVLALALTVGWNLVAAGRIGAAETSEEESIDHAISGLVSAFNQQDAAAVAAHWAQDGVYVDQQTGERVEGRAAIEAMYANVFAADIAPRLIVRVERVQFVTPEVALVDGQATVVGSAGPVASSFAAVMVKVKREWLLHSSRETALPITLKPGDHLLGLDWLVGNWVDEDSSGDVRSSVRWSAKHAFLIRSFRVTHEADVVYEATQIFGWDPAAERIKVWMFGSEGGFGEGHVDVDGDRAAIHLVGILPDGRTASATQVLTRVSNDNFTSQLVAHEVGGEPQPTPEAVNVVRAVEAKAAAPVQAKEQKAEAKTKAPARLQPAEQKKSAPAPEPRAEKSLEKSSKKSATAQE
jgi:uncharacterized protein (TIGR02246 family)